MTMMIRPYSSSGISKTSLLSCLLGKVVAGAVPGRRAFSSTTTTAAMKIPTLLLPSQWSTNTRLLSSFTVNHPLITTMTTTRTTAVVVGGVHCHPWMMCLQQGFATKKKKLKKLMKRRLRGMTTTRENIPSPDHVPDHVDDETWMKSFLELKDFVQREGIVHHTSEIDTQKLRKWTTDQREEFMKWKEGKPTTMTIEREQKLDNLFLIPWKGHDKWVHRYWNWKNFMNSMDIVWFHLCTSHVHNWDVGLNYNEIVIDDINLNFQMPPRTNDVSICWIELVLKLMVRELYGLFGTINLWNITSYMVIIWSHSVMKKIIIMTCVIGSRINDACTNLNRPLVFTRRTSY